jgi:PAS domain S-box-containing protein
MVSGIGLVFCVEMIAFFVKLSIFLALCICFQWNTIRAVAESATSAPTLISSIAQLQDLSANEAKKGLPIKLAATVLYHDVEWRVMFLKDDQRSMYLMPPQLTNGFEPGDLVEVSGRVYNDNNQNQVDLPQFRLLRHAALPPPRKTTAQDLNQNVGFWVETEGNVKSVGMNNGRLLLSLEQDGARFKVTCLNPNISDNYYLLVDSRLRIRGVNCSEIYIKPFMGQLFTTGFTNISILTPGSTNFMRLPPATVKSLAARSANQFTNARVHLEGVAAGVGQNNVISLTDSTGTILVKIPNNGDLGKQEALNVWGYPVFSNDQILIEDGITKPVEIATPYPGTTVQSHQDAATNSIPTLITRVKDLRALTAEVARQKIPVRFRGVILYCDPDWRNVFFHDGEEGIQLFLKEYPTNLFCGQRVEVAGVSDPGLYAPTVAEGDVTIFNASPLPEPIRASLGELQTGAFDSQWIETEGVVCDVDPKPGHLQLKVRAFTGRLKAIIPNYEGTTPTNLIGARVLLRGACTTDMGWDRTRLAGVNLYVPSVDSLFFKILNPSVTKLSNGPAVEIQSLSLYNPSLNLGQPVKISGWVTLIEDSLDFYLQDGTGGTRVQLLRPEAVRLGDTVEVVGFPSSNDGMIGFSDAQLRVLHSGHPLAPAEIDSIEKILFTRAYENQLVRLKGRLLESILPNVRPQLMLGNGASMFVAMLEQTGSNKPMPKLEPGSLLELTGICIMQPGEEKSPNRFRILLRNPGDIRVVQRPNWWTPRRTFRGVLILVAFAGAAMGWVWLLQRSVREKTAQIKEQIKQEEDLESRYRDLFENANDLFLTLDLQGRCTSLNGSAERFFGYTRQEALGMNIADVVVPGQVEMVRGRLHTLLNGRTPETIELKVAQRSKKIAIIEINARVFHKDGQPVGFQAIGRDVTERTQFAQALERERNLLRILIDHMPDAVFVKDSQERFLITNKAYGRMRGNEAAEAYIGKTVFDLFPKEMADRFHQDDLLILKQEKSFFNHEEKTIDAQGDSRWLVTTKVPLKDSQNQIIGLVGISRDITEQKEKENRLRQLSSAVEQSQASIVITDTKGNIEYVNPKFTEKTGFTLDAVRGKNMSDIGLISSKESVPGDLWTVMSADKEWKGELQNRKADGQLFWESAHISPIKNAAGETTHFLGIYEDITERRSLEAQLRQAQKMESVGQLAAGVAHDFNNLLTVIQGHAEMLRADPAARSENREALEEITGAVKRAANLTRQLLLFSRKQAMQPQALDLSQSIADLGKMLQRLLGEHIEMHISCQSDGALISGDPGMVEQVIVNLCVNARDAMPHGGLLTLETKLVEFAERTLLPHAEARPGRFLCLSVSDTGHGMDEKTLSRIFEPFFTTKPKGKGTGLGLATVYGIVKQHQGWVDVLSAPGKGTTFRIYFPVAEKTVKVAQTGSSAGKMRGGSECILVVEDEDALRLMVRLVLKRKGYRVICASSGLEALKLWKDCAQEVDILLTDMVMPHGMTGRQLAEQLLSERPSLRVVYTSGYSVDLMASGQKFQEDFNFLPKPYRPEDLVKIVRSCLDRAPEKTNA